MHFDLEKWKAHPAKLARDVEFARIEAEAAERAEQARIEAEAEQERQRLADERRPVLERAVGDAVHALMHAAADLESSGVHLHVVSRVAGRAAVRVRHEVEHPLDDRAGSFFGWLAESIAFGG